MALARQEAEHLEVSRITTKPKMRPLNEREGVLLGISLLEAGALVALVMLHVGPRERKDLSRINEYVQQPGFPIRYDPELKEYTLLCPESDANGISRTGLMPLAFCPWTGTRLPQSQDPRFAFGDGVEIRKWEFNLRNARNLAAVQGLLGKPDLTAGPFADVRSQLTYSSLSKRIDIIVQEKTNGEVAVLYFPKDRAKSR